MVITLGAFVGALSCAKVHKKNGLAKPATYFLSFFVRFMSSICPVYVQYMFSICSVND